MVPWLWLALAMQVKVDLPALERACGEEKTAGESCYFLGRALFVKGEFEAARQAFDKAAPSPQLYRGAAMNYVALGRNEDAERSYRKAIAAGSVDARPDLGAFLYRQGRMPEALEVLKAAYKTNPNSTRVNLEYGRVLLHAGQAEEAVKRLEKAVELNPGDANGHLLLGRAYQRVGRDADAERELALGATEWRKKQPAGSR